MPEPQSRFSHTDVVDRYVSLFTSYGQIDCVEFGELTSSTSKSTLPSGQEILTGMIAATDVAGSVMLGDTATVARLNAWRKKAKAGAGYKERSVRVVYYGSDKRPVHSVTVDEMILHTDTPGPATNQDGAGGAARYRFVVSCWNVTAKLGVAP
ncbi:MAG: hypothetical protein AB7U23_13220 [Dehalococcoidia bacterium]